MTKDDREIDAVMALWRLRNEARAALVAVEQSRRWQRDPGSIRLPSGFVVGSCCACQRDATARLR